MLTAHVFDAFVELADTLGEDFDASAYLQILTDRSVQLLDITAAGALLTDDHGALRSSAASSWEAQLLQQFQVHTGQGPSVDCFRTRRSVNADTLRTDDRWPDFAVGAADAGFAAVHAVAMRHRAQTVGVLSFFSTRPGPLNPSSRTIAQALSEIATIGLLQRDRIQSRELRVTQLRTALHSRVLVEQAKGILAERLGVSVSAALSLLRQHARSRNQRLRDVAQGIVNAAENAHTADDRAADVTPHHRQRRTFHAAEQPATAHDAGHGNSIRERHHRFGPARLIGVDGIPPRVWTLSAHHACRGTRRSGGPQCPSRHHR